MPARLVGTALAATPDSDTLTISTTPNARKSAISTPTTVVRVLTHGATADQTSRRSTRKDAVKDRGGQPNTVSRGAPTMLPALRPCRGRTNRRLSWVCCLRSQWVVREPYAARARRLARWSEPLCVGKAHCRRGLQPGLAPILETYARAQPDEGRALPNRPYRPSTGRPGKTCLAAERCRDAYRASADVEPACQGAGRDGVRCGELGRPDSGEDGRVVCSRARRRIPPGVNSVPAAAKGPGSPTASTESHCAKPADRDGTPCTACGRKNVPAHAFTDQGPARRRPNPAESPTRGCGKRDVAQVPFADKSTRHTVATRADFPAAPWRLMQILAGSAC